MLSSLRKIVSDTNPLRLLYHKLKAVVAATVYGFPSRKMTVIGVTGTNGKTTTVNLITKVLETAGYKVGMTSTINFQVGTRRWTNQTKQTTQSAFTLQKLLRDMVSEGCKYAVVEVSSHAMTQSRVWGVNIDCAVFTNITEDHLDYHGGFASYLHAKGSLFKKVSKSRKKLNVPKVMVLNQDDENFSYFDQFLADRKITYGLKNGTVHAMEVKLKAQGSEFTIAVPNNAIPISLQLPGDFNVQNALCAAAVCMTYGVTLEDIKRGLDEAQTIPGRYDLVDEGQGYAIVVDYAHAHDSLEKLLSLYRDLTPHGKLFAVFGATGGGRDVGKRPKMGEIADKYADYIILTDDDPYDDDELEIIDFVAKGIKREEGEGFWKIPDRRSAIKHALSLAKEGDCVVVAGKGAEEVMKVRGKTIPWNDKQVISEILKRTIKLEIE
jgi:UDP-N-acetylmuramoyl-L-alanyl-D-glutamate--2,6-diaminopimelate ligase